MNPVEANGVNRLALLAGMRQRLRLLMNCAARCPQTEGLSLTGHAAAMKELASWPGFQPTTLVPLKNIACASDIRSLWYKDESSRFDLGSFKALGGAYAVLRVLQKEVLRQTEHEPTSEEMRNGSFAAITRGVTVTTATDGNHGRAVAWGAQMFNCRCVIYVPKSCSRSREAAIARYGATIVRTEVGYDDTVRLCASDASQNGFMVVSDTSWPGYVDIPRDIMNGYTILVEEVLQQLPADQRLSHVFVQGGVGGLAAAVCAHFSNRLGDRAPALVVVEPERAACLFASALAGRPTPASPPVGTIMAGLDCGEVSTYAWNVLSSGAAAFITVPDAVVAPCMQLLDTPTSGDQPIVAGESAVAGLAALLISAGDSELRDALKLDTNSRVLVIGTEGNTDPEIYQSLMRSAVYQ